MYILAQGEAVSKADRCCFTLHCILLQVAKQQLKAEAETYWEATLENADVAGTTLTAIVVGVDAEDAEEAAKYEDSYDPAMVQAARAGDLPAVRGLMTLAPLLG